MKKMFITGSVLAVLLAASGCSKDILDENPRSVLVPSFFGTPDGVQSGLTGVYSGLRNLNTDQAGSVFTSQGTDEFMRGFAGTDGLEDYNGGQLNSNNGTSTGQWTQCYRFINAANGVIQYGASVRSLTMAVYTSARGARETSFVGASTNASNNGTSPKACTR
jgi:hypothetical protein